MFVALRPARRDSVCSIQGLTHARPVEADRHLASSREDAGGGAKTPGVTFQLAHTGAIADDVRRAFGGLIGSGCMRPESIEDAVQWDGPSKRVFELSTLVRID